MHEAERRWYPGIEFYNTPDMGLCGIENDEVGNQRTYQYLTIQEAIEWLTAWLTDRKWQREDVK